MVAHLVQVRIVLVGRVLTAIRIVLVGRVLMVVRIVLVGRVLTAIRIVLVGRVLMVVRIVLVGRDPLVGSGVTRVRTLVWSVLVAPAPSARRRAVLVARCRLPISGRSLSRTSGGQSRSAWRRHRRHGSASSGLMKDPCARRLQWPLSGQRRMMVLAAEPRVPSCRLR